MANSNWPPMGSGGGGGGVVTGATNVGTGVGVFQLLSGTVLQFRSIDDGTGITWTQGVNDLTANVTLAPFSTTDLTEGTNLYFTTARSRSSVSGTPPISYNPATGVFSMHVADASDDGYLSSVDWSTFNSKQAALTIGDLTDAGTDGITITGGTGAVIGAGTSIAQHVADATHNGYLLQTDWTIFNSKQAALTFGNFTDVGTDGITVTGGAGAVIGTGTSISQHVADATHNGYLSSSDWVTFSSVAPPVVSHINSNVTLANTHTYLVDTTAARTLTLPAPVSGMLITVKDSTGTASTNPIALTPSGGEKIENVAAPYSLDYDLGSWLITSDGVDWYII